MSSLSHIVRGALPAFWALPLPLTVKPLHHLFRCGFIVSFYYSNYIKLGRAAGIISTHPHPTPKQALAIGDSEKSLCFSTFSSSPSLAMGWSGDQSLCYLRTGPQFPFSHPEKGGGGNLAQISKITCSSWKLYCRLCGPLAELGLQEKPRPG